MTVLTNYYLALRFLVKFSEYHLTWVTLQNLLSMVTVNLHVLAQLQPIFSTFAGDKFSVSKYIFAGASSMILCKQNFPNECIA